jgi:phosphatidate cytidylyltransferase
MLMLKKRIITALIALPLVFAILYFVPRALVFFLFLVLAMGSTFETVSILLPALRSKLGVPIKGSTNFWVFLCTINSGIVFSCLAYRTHPAALGLLVFSVMLLLLIANFMSSSIEAAMGNMFAILFSVVFGSLPWVSLLDLYDLGDHSRYLFLLLGIVMANDTGAYFVGKYFGKHLLAPLSSPKKTWEGAVGGVLTGILGAWIINSVFWGELGAWPFIAFASVITGVAGILGDLTESALKRFGGVKDSGTIFPGHGGLLDRTDSIIFAAPVIWFLLFVAKLDLSIF